MPHAQRAITELKQADDFPEALDDRVATLLQSGENIELTYNDTAGSLTIAAPRLTREFTFTQFSLTIANKLPVVHGFGTYPSALSIVDALGNPIVPADWLNESINSLSVDLTSFVPISGTWTISLGA